MKLVGTPPGELKRLRQIAANSFQRTFATPLDRLPAFTNALIAGEPAIMAASVVIASAVFEPKHLIALLSSLGLPPNYGADWMIQAVGEQEAAALLNAVLADWLDFYFVPQPKRFVLYADHDEYTTLFASRKGPLSQVASRLDSLGIQEVVGYTRAL